MPNSQSITHNIDEIFLGIRTVAQAAFHIQESLDEETSRGQYETTQAILGQTQYLQKFAHQLHQANKETTEPIPITQDQHENDFDSFISDSVAKIKNSLITLDPGESFTLTFRKEQSPEYPEEYYWER